MAELPEKDDKTLTVQEYVDILDEIQYQPSWRALADLCHEYRDGNQYDTATLQALDEIGMAPQIENLIAPTVGAITGLEAKTRKDWKVTSGNQDFEEVAEALGQKLYEAERESHADKANTQGFDAATVGGVGWIHVGRTSDPFQYPYKYQFVHRDEMYWDMKCERPDFSDCKWLMRSKWYDIEVVKQAFPQHAELLTLAVGNWNDLALYLDSDKDTTALQYSHDLQREHSIEDNEWMTTNRKRVRVNEVWYRQWVTGLVIRLPNGSVAEFDENNEAHMSAAYQGWQVTKANFTKLRCSFWVGVHQLADFPNPYPHGEYPYIPIFANQEDRTHAPYGEVKAMLPIQDNINARNTKLIWLLASKRIVMTEGVTVDDPEMVRAEAGRPDAMHILDPEKVRQNGQFNVETDFALSQQQYQALIDARNMIKNTAGVYAAFEGSSNNQSGVALHAATEQSSQTLANLYDNYEYARARAGNQLLSLIIEDIGDNEEAVTVESDYKNNKTVVLNKRNDDGTLSNAVNQIRMKVALNDVPSTSTYKQQTLNYISQMTQGMPPQYQATMIKFMVRLMDISPADKQEIVESIMQANGEALNKEPRNEQEAQAMQAQLEEAQMAKEMQQRAAMAELETKEAQALKLKAEAQKLLNEGSGEDSEAQQQIEKYEQMLVDAQDEFDTRMIEITQKHETDLKIAQINAESRLQIAQLNSSDKQKIDELEAELDAIAEALKVTEQN